MFRVSLRQKSGSLSQIFRLSARLSETEILLTEANFCLSETDFSLSETDFRLSETDFSLSVPVTGMMV